ncbi:hypothetical protein [Flagellimonas sp.]|uniref:hypothetical protein n=1 Tax=Flagellimonas sp. TaxID=2058762 RepID=UPI003F4A0E7F
MQSVVVGPIGSSSSQCLAGKVNEVKVAGMGIQNYIQPQSLREMMERILRKELIRKNLNGNNLHKILFIGLPATENNVKLGKD